MISIIEETLFDTIKLVPFLFVAFLLIEFIEHKLNNKSKEIVSKSKKMGPIVGSLLGVFPQCGFSVLATNLYVTRIISLGTLIAIYLSTSDEMLPILLSEKISIFTIIQILLIKIFVGMLCGIIIDLFYKKAIKQNFDFCKEEACCCERGILKSSIKHTIKILAFLFFASFIINIIFVYVGEECLSKTLLKDSIFAPFLTSLIGLIPNCGASVILTQLYVNGAISLASMIGGLLTGSGVALLVLFKTNKNIKENLMILGIIYCIGLISGIVIQIINYII